MKRINKLAIKKGAIFDYEEIVCKTDFDFDSIRDDVEKLIDKSQEKQDSLRIIYSDKKSGQELMLFIKKGYKFGIMQMWILEGICNKEDYNEEMELDGSIKKWLEVEIE